jgi:uncharacterized membrane protein
MSAAVTERIDALERKLLALQRELAEVRALAEPAPARPTIVDRPSIPAPRPRRETTYAPIPPPAARPPRLQLDYSKLLSAPALAFAGGIVTVLGIVFLFVLAVERGWIGPEVRVSFGGAASVLLLLAAIILHRRFGHLHSALGAAGAGIAGAYATLLAATALYDLIPSSVALGLAAVVASAGVLLALRWSSQLVAGIGLLGAIVVPAIEAVGGGVSTVGTAFAAVVTGAAILVAIGRNWPRLAALAAVAGGLQGAVLVLAERAPEPGVVATAAAFAVVFLAGGVGWHLHRPQVSLGGLPSALILASGGFAFYSALLLFDGLGQAVALLVASAVYGAASAWLFRVRAYRDLSSLLLALALAVGAVGVAALLSGASLTYVWAAEAVVLFWLARRLREIRFQVGALVYLVLAAAHALTNEAHPEALFTITATPEAAIPSAVALSAACGLSAFLTRKWRGGHTGERGLFRVFGPLLNELRAHQEDVRVILASWAGIFALYALALGIVAAFAALGGSFAEAHAVVSGVWGLAGVGLLYAGLRNRRRTLQRASLGWLGATTLEVLAFDTTQLDTVPRSAALLAVAGSLFAAGALLERFASRREPLGLAAAATATVSLGLGLAAICTLLDGTARGFALVILAGVYAGAAAAFLRTRRDYSTLLWAFSLGVAAASLTELVSGQWLVACYAAGAAALAWVGVAAGERRLQLGSLVYLGLSLVVLIGDAASPTNFFTAGEHPAAGVPAVLAVAAAIAAVALSCGRRNPEAGDGVDGLLDRLQRRLRAFLLWTAGAVALYGVSLAILGLVELIRTGTLESSFQSGHTAVSAAWGLLGLVLLYLGLRRGSRPLQLGGFALFGVSLAKLFLFDLAHLSSVTRALSFLAVGAVLLLAGFFYQRLSSRAKRPRSPVDGRPQSRDVLS